jgi:hypothetical protein
MLDAILDELQAVFAELAATLKELDTKLGKAYEAFLERLAHRLYRFGYWLQGEEYELTDDWD